MTNSQAVDIEHAKSALAKVTAELEPLRAQKLGSVSLVDYHYDKLVGTEIYEQLWSDVIRGGWDAAAQRVANIVRQATASMSYNTPRHLLEIRFALRWWTENRRRAMAEGLDLELFVLAI